MSTFRYVAAGLEMCSVEGIDVLRTAKLVVKNDGCAKVYIRSAIQGTGVIAGCPVRLAMSRNISI